MFLFNKVLRLSNDAMTKFATTYIPYFLEMKYDADITDSAKVGNVYIHTHVRVSVSMCTYMSSIVVTYYLLRTCYTVIYIYI